MLDISDGLHTDLDSGRRLTSGDGYLEALVKPSKSRLDDICGASLTIGN